MAAAGCIFHGCLQSTASLSGRPGPAFCKPFTVKRPEEDREPLPFYSSKPYICFFCPLSLSDLLCFFFPACLCVSFPLSFHSSELNAAWSANRLSPLIFSLFSFFSPHSSLSSCAFLRLSLSPLFFLPPSAPSLDYYSDTAYPAVISLITFKQFSVAISPSIACLSVPSL